MDNDKQFNNEEIYSKRVRAGRRRTYFFDVRTTRTNDYYITITESKKRFDGDGYERHKIHLYKEDFNKFLQAFQDTVGHVKEELMPDYDYDEFSRDYDEDYEHKPAVSTTETAETSDSEEETVEQEESVDVVESFEELSEDDPVARQIEEEHGDDDDDDDDSESWD